MPYADRAQRLAYYRTYYINHRARRDAERKVHRQANRAHVAILRRGYQTSYMTLTRAILDGELARGCVDCGIKDFDVLEFDHRPGELKSADVASMTGGWTRRLIYAEIDKCDVRCANCHRKVTAERRRAAKKRAPPAPHSDSCEPAKLAGEPTAEPTSD